MVEVRKELVQIAKEYKWGKLCYMSGNRILQEDQVLMLLFRCRFGYRLVRQSNCPFGAFDAAATLSV